MRERFAFCGQTAARTGLTLLLVATALLASGGCERAHSQAAPVARDSWAHGVGYVEPAGEVRRLAFSRPGVIATCAARVGGRVGAGHVLMTLRAESELAALVEAEAALMLAQAELAQVRAGVNAPQIAAVRAAQAAAEADAAHARQELVRQRQLLEHRASSQAEFELADTARRRAEAIAAQRNAELSHLSEYVRDTDVAVAAARVQLAAARLERARREVSETRLLAPADGVVLECLRREGEATHPGDGAAASSTDASRS